jgi:hypothetical protein
MENLKEFWMVQLLRRDMVGILEISGPQERGDVEHPGGTSSLQGSTVHSWEPGSQRWEQAKT